MLLLEGGFLIASVGFFTLLDLYVRGLDLL